MIPRPIRLPKARIGFVILKGKKLANQYFTVKYVPARAGLRSRFAAIISAKVHPKAVKRNRIRRQIYEIIRLNRPEVKTAYDVIIIGKTPLAELNYKKIQELIVSLFKKIA